MSTIRTPDLQRGTTATGDADAAIEAVRERATPLTTDAVDRLATHVADSTYVLLGEASHGTSEFYRWRARLTARLVDDYGFDLVAVEGDWTDCYDVNRYVTGGADRRRSKDGGAGFRDDERHLSNQEGPPNERTMSNASREPAETTPPGGALDVLDGFDRWPTWMWANWEVVEFVDWLRRVNDDRSDEENSVGFYGMDVYSLFESMAAVIEYLEDVDPEAADEAREAYACFEPYREDGQSYARDLRMTPEGCEDEVVDVLSALRSEPQAGEIRQDRFAAQQNALVAKNAESYYRALVQADVESWNVRDQHMVETLERLRSYHGSDSKVIVWAHNTHVGDARATDMARRGEVNVGQLVREQVGADEAAIVGFGTERGSVVASDAWGNPAREMSVPPAKDGSYESVFHRAGVGDSIVTFGDGEDGPLAEPRGHRAIGVVYHPKRELGNYVPTVLPDRYDAYVHVDETHALHPVGAERREGATDECEPPATYPWGM